MCKTRTLWQTAPVQPTSPKNRPIQDPPWQGVARFSRAELPLSVRAWLLDEQSLTARLIARSKGNFEVLRLGQHWGRPLASEQDLLASSAQRWALIREVVLRCHGEPWVYARSVIPLATLSGNLRHLRHLQNQSLGALIFRNPQLRRSHFEVALLPAGSDYIRPGWQQQAPAWARRSRFSIGSKHLSVSEVFLQQFQP